MKSLHDVVNALPLRVALRQRSESRGDLPAISDWMTKQFHRWIINTFEHTVPFEIPQTYLDFTGEEIPDWLSKKIAEGGPQQLVMISHDQPYLCELERRCVEWLQSKSNTLLAKKFPRMTPDHVLAHWRSDHQRIEKIRAIGFLETSGGALKTVLRLKGTRVVEFMPTHPEFRKELNNESIHMGHCLGQFSDRDSLEGGYGDYYAQAAADGHLRLFSLRNGRGAPHVTVSVQQTNGVWVVEQVKGKQNRPPLLKYAPPVKALLNGLDISPTHHSDCAMAGLFMQNGRYVSIEELEDHDAILRAIAVHPGLIGKVGRQSPAAQWLAVLSDPTTVTAVMKPDLVMRTAAALLDPYSSENLNNVRSDVDDTARDRSRGNIEGQSFRLRNLAPKEFL